MRIALDYDGTYTAAPDFWEAVIELAKQHGHEIFILTKRESEMGAPTKADIPKHYTRRTAKAMWAKKNGLGVDIWIDDGPMNLFVSDNGEFYLL